MEDILFWLMTWSILTLGGSLFLLAVTPWPFIYCLLLSGIAMAAILMGAEDVIDDMDDLF